ncbi:MAG: hypothetical protein GAK30_03343 [Paracidovorax wautersii]|uniref:LemA protein n=1 Tax=Paracidovorax wautersii TaxID=1177982 RepID=A0A7V8FLF1_9BURK|nr:MAG: hypothetical protein GAK30_03343 [Paracidovorax wautersii]
MTIWIAVIAVVIVICWATGAHSRLARLRAAVVASFAPVGETAQRLSSVIHAALDWQPVAAEGAAGDAAVLALAEDAGSVLRGTLMQYVAAVAVAQSRPLSADAIAALNAAQSVLWPVWQARLDELRATVAPETAGLLQALASSSGATAASADEPAGEAAAPAADAAAAPYFLLASQWHQAQAQYGLMAEKFNLCVREHNAAVRQFPAVVLAWAMGFQPARAVAVPALAVPPAPSSSSSSV